ncbi:hypothetical protein ACU40O_09815 [Staphylococcus arlettae]
MAYEYEKENIRKLNSYNVLSGGANITKPINELQEVYRKAKAFDEVKEFINRKLKEEEKEKPRTLLSDYDFGLYQAYDNVDDVIQDFEECADDGR